MGKKRRASSPYVYRARVVRRKKTFVLETPQPLDLGSSVKHEDKSYRVTYLYTNGTRGAVAILTPIVRRTARKAKKRRK